VSVRRLDRDDLAAALAIQREAYPAFLRDGEAAFASRGALADSYCLAATLGDSLVAYLLAHGWPSQSPPPIDAEIGTESPSEVLFVHDLAVAPAGRGFQIGRGLIERAFEAAARNGLSRCELIAVEGARGYWETLGFLEAAAPPELATKIASYGPAARWMTRSVSVDLRGD
jgi:GNAT superfamily N-acetyltransferase